MKDKLKGIVKRFTRHRAFFRLVLTAFVVAFIVVGASIGLWQTYHSSLQTAQTDPSSNNGNLQLVGDRQPGSLTLTQPTNSAPATSTPTLTSSANSASTPTLSLNSITTPTSSTNKSASAGEVCSKRSLPYKTVTNYVSNLPKGQESVVYAGSVGLQEFCTNSSGVERVISSIWPVDRIINVGSGDSCSYAWDVPFKNFFVAGSGYDPGYNGYGKTCTHSDGSTPTYTVLIQPHNQVNYINQTSSDYGNALKICTVNYDFTGGNVDECMKIAWHP